MENQANKRIIEANRIAIFTHINCDGDGIGTMSALYFVLTQMGKTVHLFCDSTIPKRFEIYGTRELINVEKFDVINYDLLISVDVSTKERLGKYADSFDATANTICFDHHVSNENFANVNIIEESVSSCAEVVFSFLKDYNYEISAVTAKCLYGALSSDTGMFQTSSTNYNSHKVAAELISYGANNWEIDYQIQKRKTKNQFELLKLMLNKVKVFGEVAVLYISLKDYAKTKTDTSDSEKFFHILTDIAGVRITNIIKQKDKHKFSISFRSAGNIDVCSVASTFGGGGHLNSAGAIVNGKITEIKKKLLRECNKEINRHND